jgi:integrase
VPDRLRAMSSAMRPDARRSCRDLEASQRLGIPLPVIQKVLDHASLEMTNRYAQLHDDTLRREVRRWHERVNVRGERIALSVDGPPG